MKHLANKLEKALRHEAAAQRRAKEEKKWRRVERAVERHSLGLDEKTRSNAAIQRDLSRDPIAAAKADAAFKKKLAGSAAPPDQITISASGAPSAQNDKAADFGAEDWCPRKKVAERRKAAKRQPRDSQS